MPEITAIKSELPAVKPAGGHQENKPIGIKSSALFRELMHGPSKAAFSAGGPAVQPPDPRTPQTAGEGHAAVPERRTRRDDGDPIDPWAGAVSCAPLDALFCQLAVNPALASTVQPDSAALLVPAPLLLREELQSLLSGLSRRAAWGGDRRRGSARIELSEGVLAGATLLVVAEADTVSVELELPPGMPAHSWQERIAERLAGRGFQAQVRVG